MAGAGDRAGGALAVSTIEADYSQVIGACMQFLSLQELRLAPRFLLRVVEGARHPVLMAAARAAGMDAMAIPRTVQNRFANKWAGLEEVLPETGGAVVLDWDVLNTGASSLPPMEEGTSIRARPNAPEIFAAWAARARACSPECWKGTALPSSINSGVAMGAAQAIARMARRVGELAPRLREALPEAADWQLEKLAASMAAGEAGLAPLRPEWNATAYSEVPDEEVLFWHYNNGHAAAQELKRVLHRPEEAEERLDRLSARWPRQVERFRGLYDCALRRLELDLLIRPHGRAGPKAERNGEVDPLPKVRNLLATCSSGLCNRLLLLAGAMRAAKLTQRKVLLYWPANTEAGCAFSDLFENDIRTFAEGDLNYLLNTAVTVQLYNAWRMRGPQFPDLAPDGDPQAEIVLVKGWYYPKFSHEEYNGRFFESVREQLLSLRPRRALIERAERFGLPERCLGVHLRRGEAFPEFHLSRDEHFEAIMSALLREFPDLKFFLSTDDPATEEKFRGRFGERVLHLPKTGGGRRTREGMEEAMVDLLLLSRTRAIIGNNFSTFSHAASALGGVPVVFAKEETAVLDLDSTLETFRGALAR